MTIRVKKKALSRRSPSPDGYDAILAGISELLEESRRTSARTVNAIMTLTYWEVGRRIVEFEQAGKGRAEYGTELLKRLSVDLTQRFGRGFSRAILEYMRRFYETWPIPQTVSGELAQGALPTSNEKSQTPSGVLESAGHTFPLPWSHYIRLLAVKNQHARQFYEQEAVRGGWSIRQLDRQISSQFYERTALSKNKAVMLTKGQQARPEDLVTPEQAIKDPYVLEFLDLKDEYSESDLEAALNAKLEHFLLELGDEWYRIGLLFFHRRLRCLVIIDLKLGRFTRADACIHHRIAIQWTGATQDAALPLQMAKPAMSRRRIWQV